MAFSSGNMHPDLFFVILIVSIGLTRRPFLGIVNNFSKFLEQN